MAVLVRQWIVHPDIESLWGLGLSWISRNFNFKDGGFIIFKEITWIARCKGQHARLLIKDSMLVGTQVDAIGRTDSLAGYLIDLAILTINLPFWVEFHLISDKFICLFTVDGTDIWIDGACWGEAQAHHVEEEKDYWPELHRSLASTSAGASTSIYRSWT